MNETDGPPPDAVAIDLVCWTCGEVKQLLVNKLPDTAVGLTEVATAVGWLGGIDTARRRSLVFCSKPCRILARNKAGEFRAHPPTAAQIKATARAIAAKRPNSRSRRRGLS